MDAQTCLKKMQLVGTLSMATVDENGAPQIRCVSAVHYEPDAVYFLTSRGKEMTRQLMADGRIQTLVHTRFNEMIRMSGRAELAPEDEQRHWVDIVFEEQPYLANVYPGDTRDICVIFKVTGIVLDYFNLGVHPIERDVYTLDGSEGPHHRCLHRLRYVSGELPAGLHRRGRAVSHRGGALSALRCLCRELPRGRGRAPVSQVPSHEGAYDAKTRVRLPVAYHR